MVEDNPLRATVLETHLSRQGWPVLHAADGRTALDVLARTPGIDFVITDIGMPGMDGLELIAAIRARPEWQYLPILVTTARASTELVMRAASLGVRHMCVKPFNVGQLVQQVRGILQAELPALRSREQVQLTLGINDAAYQTLVRGFDDLVATRLSQLEACMAEDSASTGSVDAELAELRESASLVGADRLVGAIDSVLTSARDGSTDATSLAALVRELHRVRAALGCSGATDSAAASKESPAAVEASIADELRSS